MLLRTRQRLLPQKRGKNHRQIIPLTKPKKKKIIVWTRQVDDLLHSLYVEYKEDWGEIALKIVSFASTEASGVTHSQFDKYDHKACKERWEAIGSRSFADEESLLDSSQTHQCTDKKTGIDGNDEASIQKLEKIPIPPPTIREAENLQ
jgi:hypothetical protein